MSSLISSASSFVSGASDYTFHNMGRIGNDVTDKTQRNLQNGRYSSYNTSTFFPDNLTTNKMDFALSQPTNTIHGLARGKGLGAGEIDFENTLVIKTGQERPTEKLQLFQRPFATVPYLGKGYGDPVLELQLLQGETIADKKSVSTIMDKSFMPYHINPQEAEMNKQWERANHSVEEVALKGWVRGGVATRDINDPISSSSSK